MASSRVSEAGTEVSASWAFTGGAEKNLPPSVDILGPGVWPVGGSRAWTMASCHPGPLETSSGTHTCFWEETGTPRPQRLWVWNLRRCGVAGSWWSRWNGRLEGTAGCGLHERPAGSFSAGSEALPIPQVVLIISGNLSFLNWLTIVPSVACFDDATLGFLFPSGPGGLKDQVLKMQKEKARGAQPTLRYGGWIPAGVNTWPYPRAQHSRPGRCWPIFSE